MNQLVKIEDIDRALAAQREHFASILPESLQPDKFLAASRSAILARPELMRLPAVKVMRELDKAANDGLVPDGREAVINVYKGDPCYIPMILGIRKRAIELANIYVSAEVVHAADTFKVHRGDDPHIEHADPAPGAQRGEMIAAYAIFRKLMPDGKLVIVHREVMDKAMIFKVKAFSKQQEGLLWGAFEQEAWRKTVARRGIKSVPAVPDKLMQIFKRDDEHYDFSRGAAVAAGPALMPPSMEDAQHQGAVEPPPGAPLTVEHSTAPVGGGNPSPLEPPPMPPAMAGNEQPKQGQSLLKSREDAFLETLDGLLGKAKDLKALSAIWERNSQTIENKLPEAAKQRAFKLWDKHEARFING